MNFIKISSNLVPVFVFLTSIVSIANANLGCEQLFNNKPILTSQFNIRSSAKTVVLFKFPQIHGTTRYGREYMNTLFMTTLHDNQIDLPLDFKSLALPKLTKMVEKLFPSGTIFMNGEKSHPNILLNYFDVTHTIDGNQIYYSHDFRDRPQIVSSTITKANDNLYYWEYKTESSNRKGDEPNFTISKKHHRIELARDVTSNKFYGKSVVIKDIEVTYGRWSSNSRESTATYTVPTVSYLLEYITPVEPGSAGPRYRDEGDISRFVCFTDLGLFKELHGLSSAIR